jgi:hypothetical protein
MPSLLFWVSTSASIPALQRRWVMSFRGKTTDGPNRAWMPPRHAVPATPSEALRRYFLGA